MNMNTPNALTVNYVCSARNYLLKNTLVPELIAHEAKSMSIELLTEALTVDGDKAKKRLLESLIKTTLRNVENSTVPKSSVTLLKVLLEPLCDLASVQYPHGSKPVPPPGAFVKNRKEKKKMSDQSIKQGPVAMTSSPPAATARPKPVKQRAQTPAVDLNPKEAKRANTTRTPNSKQPPRPSSVKPDDLRVASPIRWSTLVEDDTFDSQFKPLSESVEEQRLITRQNFWDLHSDKCEVCTYVAKHCFHDVYTGSLAGKRRRYLLMLHLYSHIDGSCTYTEFVNDVTAGPTPLFTEDVAVDLSSLRKWYDLNDPSPERSWHGSQSGSWAD
jgi:hypothetical protein